MRIIPFEIEHFDSMVVGGHISRENRDVFAAYPKSGPAITLLNENSEPIASAGMVCIWKGVGDLWMIPGVDVPTYKLAVWKAATRFVRDVINDFNLHRVQATIREDDAVAIQWIERLGFERESMLRCFGPNKENFFIYARIQNV